MRNKVHFSVSTERSATGACAEAVAACGKESVVFAGMPLSRGRIANGTQTARDTARPLRNRAASPQAATHSDRCRSQSAVMLSPPRTLALSIARLPCRTLTPRRAASRFAGQRRKERPVRDYPEPALPETLSRSAAANS